MDEDFLSSVSEFSEESQEVMLDMVSGDNGFHTNAFASELPFYGMMESDQDGFITISDSIRVSIGSDITEFVVTLEKSDDQKCWFFKVENGGESFSGILNFNTLYNARGTFAFAFINDNECETFDDMTKSVPYCNFFAMVK